MWREYRRKYASSPNGFCKINLVNNETRNKNCWFLKQDNDKPQHWQKHNNIHKEDNIILITYLDHYLSE